MLRSLYRRDADPNVVAADTFRESGSEGVIERVCRQVGTDSVRQGKLAGSRE